MVSMPDECLMIKNSNRRYQRYLMIHRKHHGTYYIIQILRIIVSLFHQIDSIDIFFCFYHATRNCQTKFTLWNAYHIKEKDKTVYDI